MIANTTVLARAAVLYGHRGIAVLPTIFNDDHLPKRPISDSYPRFTPEDNAGHDWSRADGLAIALGKPSGGLALIDVDDLGLSEYLKQRVGSDPAPPLMATTARSRLHLYCQETSPSRPLDLEVSYQGRRCLVQLLAAACCAVAPPTRGYAWVDAKAEPLYGSVGACWHHLAVTFGLPYRAAKPWSFLRRERSRGPTIAQLRESL